MPDSTRHVRVNLDTVCHLPLQNKGCTAHLLPHLAIQATGESQSTGKLALQDVAA